MFIAVLEPDRQGIHRVVMRKLGNALAPPDRLALARACQSQPTSPTSTESATGAASRHSWRTGQPAHSARARPIVGSLGLRMNAMVPLTRCKPPAACHVGRLR